MDLILTAPIIEDYYQWDGAYGSPRHFVDAGHEQNRIQHEMGRIVVDSVHKTIVCFVIRVAGSGD